jgi:hypothetical protein
MLNQRCRTVTHSLSREILRAKTQISYVADRSRKPECHVILNVLEPAPGLSVKPLTLFGEQGYLREGT